MDLQIPGGHGVSIMSTNPVKSSRRPTAMSFIFPGQSAAKMENRIAMPPGAQTARRLPPTASWQSPGVIDQSVVPTQGARKLIQKQSRVRLGVIGHRWPSRKLPAPVRDILNALAITKKVAPRVVPFFQSLSNSGVSSGGESVRQSSARRAFL